MPGEESDDVGNTGVLCQALPRLLQRCPRVAILGEDIGTLLDEELHDLRITVRNLEIHIYGLRVSLCEVGYLNSGRGDCGEKEALGRKAACLFLG